MMLEQVAMELNRETVVNIGGLLVLLGLIFILSLVAYKHRGLNRKHFQKRWVETVQLLNQRQTWQQAVIDADKLVDEALKRRQYKGKTMGERLISASKSFSNNDSIWRAHKLRNKLVHEEGYRAKKQEIHRAMAGYRKALKDLGAL